MTYQLRSNLFTALTQRRLGSGGFSSQTNAGYRADSTAWAILALRTSGAQPVDLDQARARLAEDQQPDGRISMAPEHPEAYWPTPLAILAWHQAPAFREARGKAVQFLIKNAGRHFPKQKDSEGHDPAIKGWPWILDTSSWVVPTSLAVIALRVTGHGRHERVQEALRLLLDRQLPAGGWNYGNTTLFGQQLHPMPENTGMALNALTENAPLESVAKSLAYLKDRMAHVRTPIALSWSLLGLGAWGERPPEAAEWLGDCWRQQGRYGIYDTTSISLMLIALTAPRGIVSLFGPEGG